MKVHVFKSEEAASIAAAMLVSASILAKPQAVLGLEVKQELIPVYQKLIAFHRAGALALKNINCFNWSEFLPNVVNANATTDQASKASLLSLSTANLLQTNFYDYVDIPQTQQNMLDLSVRDLNLACLSYEAKIKELGGIDLGLLSLASDGSLAFNQPDLALTADSHLIDLNEQQRQELAHDYPEYQVPQQVLSVGIATLLRAKQLVVLVAGRTKAAALRTLVRGAIDPQCPASFLQLHPNCLILVDEAAASLI